MYHNENIDELIAKVLAGEAQGDEVLWLETWRKLTAENESYFQDSEKLFSAIASVNTQHLVNTDEAWARMQIKMEAPAEPAPAQGKVIPLFRENRWLQAAASVVLLVAFAFVMRAIFFETPAQPTVLASTNKTVEKQLPDGSKVMLNKNSELAYVKNGKRREVKLNGEAFFEVVHNEEEPFVINIDEVTIKDIGTAFNVKAMPGTNIIEVFVESGEVEFSALEAEGFILKKGEKASYDKVSKQFSRQQASLLENVSSYHSRVFHFSESNLNNVIEQVNAVYGCDIRLADERLGNCRLSVVFNNENIDVLIGIIAETLDLKVRKQGDTVYLEGAPCE